jgi:hypothetical protein
MWKYVHTVLVRIAGVLMLQVFKTAPRYGCATCSDSDPTLTQLLLFMCTAVYHLSCQLPCFILVCHSNIIELYCAAADKLMLRQCCHKTADTPANRCSNQHSIIPLHVVRC